MDRLRQEFELAEMLGDSENTADELLALMEALRGHPGPFLPSQTATENVALKAVKGRLASLVINVQGADPKRWARRIEKRISEGDGSVTLLQKQAARSALR